jgi:hypothetical protein
MPLYDNNTLPKIEDDVATVAPADRPDKKNPHSIPGRRAEVANALLRKGVDAKLKTGQTWRTQIEFDPVHAPSEDGAGVECKVLGPDHPSGSKPDSSNLAVCPNRHILDDFGDYKKGHLLNEWLGGPGVDTRNLAAIPTKTNGAMSQDMEETLKKLVNDNRGWIYYRAKVDHKQTKKKKNKNKLWYANKITCDWYELKPDGGGLPVEVPGTRANAVFDIPDPFEYKNAGKEAAGFDKKVTNKVGTPEKLDAATAVADVNWNAIVLRNWDYAKKLRDAFDVAEPLVAELKQNLKKATAEEVGTSLVDAICTAPAKPEEDALTWLDTELKALQGDPLRPPDPNLRTKLGDYGKERKKRIDDVLLAVDALLKKHIPTKAAAYKKKVENLLVANDPLAVYNGLLEQVLNRHDAVANNHQALIISDAEYRANTMSPQSIYTVDETLNKATHDATPADSRKRVRAAAHDTTSDNKNQKVIQGQKPTRSAELLALALVEIKVSIKNNTLVLPAAFDTLQGIDVSFHKSIKACLIDTTGTWDEDLLTSLVRGYAADSKHDKPFMDYLVGMKQIADFAKAFTSAAGKL